MKSLVSRIAAVVLLTGWITTGSSWAGPSEKTAQGAEAKGKAAAAQTLEKAFEQSRKEGKPVAIDLETEDPKRIQKGDLVEVHFTARDEAGRLAVTTRPEVADDASLGRVDGYQAPKALLPEQLVAGSAGSPFGLGEAILGLEAGQKKTVEVPAEKAFGKPDPKLRKQYPCRRSMPRVVRLSAEEYVARYKAFPKLGLEVDWVPYFPARVQGITDTAVDLELLANDGDAAEEPFGTATVQVSGEAVTIHLTPRIGGTFPMQDREGRVVASDAESFTVDFNPPLAGNGAVVDLEVVALTKSSAFKDKEINWIESRDEGLAAAGRLGKPVVLVLYADWCNFCKRLFDETLHDPRIKSVREDFVWVRVNSDKDKDAYQQYEQKGFPLIVLMDETGKTLKKIDGYRDAGAFRSELAALQQRHASLPR